MKEAAFPVLLCVCVYQPVITFQCLSQSRAWDTEWEESHLDSECIPSS